MTRFGVFWTLGNFLKPLATTNSPKSPTFLGNFCKGFKIFHFSSQIIFGQHLAIFFWSHCLSVSIPISYSYHDHTFDLLFLCATEEKIQKLKKIYLVAHRFYEANLVKIGRKKERKKVKNDIFLLNEFQRNLKKL